MALYDGAVSVRLEGDEQKALALIPDAKALLARVQTILKGTGANTYALSRRIGDNSYIYALVAGTVNTVHISVDPVVPDKVIDPATVIPGTAKDIDFYSGFVFGGALEPVLVQDANGRQVQILVCATFAPTESCRQQFPNTLLTGRQNSQRLAVTVRQELRTGESNQESQYEALRSSMYSGVMARVVQLVMGYGWLKEDQVVDPAITTKSQIPQYLTEILGAGVQVRYDYKFHRTHGIARGADQRLWLIEISMTRGVLAMPLPYFAGTDTPAFRALADAADNHVLAAVLDDLRGLPSGELFPTKLDAAIAAGDVIQMLEPEDLQPFYRCAAYSSAMGWTFNESGTEAHNTGYYTDEDGQTGYHYQLSFAIGAIDENREPGDPIANAVARFVIQGRGPLWANSSLFGRYIPFKAHEPLLPGLLSHDAHVAGAAEVSCNTTVFVAFHGDEIKVAKFFYDMNAYPDTNVTDTREGCLYAGEWAVTTNTGNLSVSKAIYTNDIDDRQALRDSSSVLTITSTDIGFDPPRLSDFLENPDWCILFRERVFERIQTTDVKNGEFVLTMLAVPYGDRNAYFYAYGHGYLNHYFGRARNYDKLIDPNIYYGHRNVFGGSFEPVPEFCDASECGFVHTNRRVVCYSIEPYPCSEYADHGPWADLCEDILSKVGTPPRRTEESTNEDLGEDGTAHLTLASPGLDSPYTQPMELSVARTWQLPSPHPISGAIQGIRAQHTLLGAVTVIHDVNLQGSGVRVVGYAPDQVGENEFPTIIGLNGNV